MAWAKVDDRLWFHPKMLAVSLQAQGLWLMALSHAAGLERDGWFPSEALTRLTKSDVDVVAIANELLAKKLWLQAGDGYQIHDYLRYNKSRKQLIRERKAAAKRRATSRKRHAVTSRDVRLTRPDPTRPVLRSSSPSVQASCNGPSARARANGLPARLNSHPEPERLGDIAGTVLRAIQRGQT